MPCLCLSRMPGPLVNVEPHHAPDTAILANVPHISAEEQLELMGYANSAQEASDIGVGKNNFV